jgi:hypothetical protein
MADATESERPAADASLEALGYTAELSRNRSTWLGRVHVFYSCVRAVWVVDHHVILFDRWRLGQHGMGLDPGLAHYVMCGCFPS